MAPATWPEVDAVTLHDARAVLPFTVGKVKPRAVFHMAPGVGHDVPLWDGRAASGDTNMLTETVPLGQSMARAMGQERCMLIRGHGATCCGMSLRVAVFVSIYMAGPHGGERRPAAADAAAGRAEVSHARRDRSGAGDAAVGMPQDCTLDYRMWDYRLARAGFAGL